MILCTVSHPVRKRLTYSEIHEADWALRILPFGGRRRPVTAVLVASGEVQVELAGLVKTQNLVSRLRSTGRAVSPTAVAHIADHPHHGKALWAHHTNQQKNANINIKKRNITWVTVKKYKSHSHPMNPKF